MTDAKRCAGCGAKIIRQYFTMVDAMNKEVVICPKCKKLWNKYSSNAKKAGDKE